MQAWPLQRGKLKKIPWGPKGRKKPTALLVTSRRPVDRFYLRLALEAARQATRQGEVPVGACLVYRGQALVAGNRVEAERNGMAHAEMIVLLEASRRFGRYLQEASLYVTLEPCAMCAGAMLHMRIGRLFFATADPERGAVISHFGILADGGNYHHVRVSSGLYQKEASLLLRHFFQDRRRKAKADSPRTL